MFVVGVTGGIGSGKTAVTDYFSQKGIEVIDADLASRQVVAPGSEALAAIKSHFGEAIILANGELDRPALRKIIFSNNEEKIWLESLLHPLIAREIMHGLQSANSVYAIFSSPLLFESGQEAICNRVLLIDVPEEIQVQRTIQRDNNDESQVKRIIASQMPRQERLAKADDIILNDQDMDYLFTQVDKLHKQYLNMAEK